MKGKHSRLSRTMELASIVPWTPRETLTHSITLIYKLLISTLRRSMNWLEKKLNRSQSVLQSWLKQWMILKMILIVKMKNFQQLPSRIQAFKTVILSFRRSTRSKQEKNKRQIIFWVIWPGIPLLIALLLTKLQLIQTMISDNNNSNTTNNKTALKLHSQLWA